MARDGKVALVTGASRRIGRSIALGLADRGFDLALHFNTSEQAAAETAAEIQGRGRRTILLQADLRDSAAAAALPDRAADALGSLNCLVNNASLFEPTDLERFDVADWNATLAVNLTAPMLLSHAAHPHVRAGGHGRIVNLVDISAQRPWMDYAAYCVSKAGLSCLTLALARAMAPDVTVNAVAPGAAVFPEDYDAEKIKRITRRIPAMRAGSVEDIAAAVVFLVTSAEYITGAVLSVDGGRSIAW